MCPRATKRSVDRGQAIGRHAGTKQVPLADAGVLDGDVPRVGGVADTDVGTDGVSVTDISEADEPSPANEHTPARGDDTNQDAGAALVLKVGGKAEHLPGHLPAGSLVSGGQHRQGFSVDCPGNLSFLVEQKRIEKSGLVLEKDVLIPCVSDALCVLVC